MARYSGNSSPLRRRPFTSWARHNSSLAGKPGCSMLSNASSRGRLTSANRVVRGWPRSSLLVHRNIRWAALFRATKRPCASICIAPSTMLSIMARLRARLTASNRICRRIAETIRQTTSAAMIQASVAKANSRYSIAVVWRLLEPVRGGRRQPLQQQPSRHQTQRGKAQQHRDFEPHASSLVSLEFEWLCVAVHGI